MKEEIYQRIASLTGSEVAQLKKLTIGELIQNVILPDICFKDPHHVSEEFIYFMSEFGQDIYNQNPIHGEALYDLALQSIFQDGCFFELPEIYKNACLQMNRIFGLTIGKTEFAFLKAQMPFLLSKKSSRLMFPHARKILFLMLEGISPKGKRLRESIRCKDGISPLEIRRFAEETSTICMGVPEIYVFLATPKTWKIWPQFFLDNENEINWKELAKKLHFSAFFHSGKKCRKMIEYYQALL